jgi:hypothetical protein
MQYPIELNVSYQEKQSRLTTLFRIFMIIPQIIVLYFIMIAAGIIRVISWFAIVFTGRNPKALFDFNVWSFRWMTNVMGYAYLLTDKYPPYTGAPTTMSPEPPKPAAQ